MEQESKYDSLEPLTEVPEYCTAMVPTGKGTLKECRKLIETMTWKGSGVCGDLHNKIRNGEKIGEPKALTP